MNKRTRYFMVGSTAIVALVLCTGLVAFYNGGLPLMSSSQGPSEMAYLPADSVAVGYASVPEVMDSEFRQKMLSVLPGREGQDEFFQHTGINIERDIDTVLAAMPLAEPDKAGVVLVRGRFNDGQIEGLIRQHGGTMEQYQGVRLVVGNPEQMASPDMSRDGDNSHESFALAFLDIGLLAVGSETAVKAAIDAKASGVNATTNADLMKYIGDIRAGQSAWAVGRFDAIAGSSDMPADLKQHLPAVQWFSVSTRINGGVMGTMRAETADDVAAENLRDVVRGALAMGRLMSGEDMRMKLFLDSLQMSGTGNTVALNFSVSPEILDALVGVAGMAETQQIR
ncbi:MAG: hypothetical protein O2917_10405 [Acidobacteria bacterium]|nr:hypothetical protein [Acidobacteriota bacterium]